MKFRLSVAMVMGINLILSSCEKNNVEIHDQGSSSIDYLIFGHTSGFCMNCDAVYKIVDGSLLGANHQVISNPDSVKFIPFPKALYDSVSLLSTQTPSHLFSGSTTSINTAGSYFPDVGHTYIEVSQNRKVYRWFIEAANVPSDLTDFIKQVNDALIKLN